MGDPSVNGNVRTSQSTSPRTSGVNENYSRPRLESTDSGLIRNTHRKFLHSAPPLGFFHASGAIASNLPTITDVQKGRYNSDGWSGPGQRRNSQAHRDSDIHVLNNVGQNPVSNDATFRNTLGPTLEAPSGREEIVPAIEDGITSGLSGKMKLRRRKTPFLLLPTRLPAKGLLLLLHHTTQESRMRMAINFPRNIRGCSQLKLACTRFGNSF